MRVPQKSFRKSVRSSYSNGIVSHRAKKSLGQNFLTDDNIARKIVGSLSLSKEDFVVEIGPGKGALTKLISKSNAKVEAIEKDNHLFGILQEKFSVFPNIKLINADFLEWEFPVSRSLAKVVGNIPYNLTSSIVSKLVDERSKIDFAVLMVQDEVAKRLSAAVGTKDYGSISIRLQLVADVNKLFPVSPNCFQPKPKVNSRIIKITFRKREMLDNESEFVSFIKRAFGMRRKMFRHFVSHYYGKESINLLPDNFKTNRIESFTPEDIYHLFTILENNVQTY